MSIVIRKSFLCLCLLHSCSQGPDKLPPPEIGFYFWQSSFAGDSLNACYFEVSNNTPLYLKVMDVAWKNARPTPLSRLQFQRDSFPGKIIPVIFMTNEVFRHLTVEGTPILVNNILAGTQDILGLDFKVARELGAANSNEEIVPKRVFNSSQIQEIQIDCDWTAGTKGRYFHFLKELQHQLPPTVKLSVTVRLHQYLNQQEQGIPPVDRGVLMAYNVGELDDPNTENSILDTNITANYLRPEIDYSLPLDLALPYYQWGVIYRDSELLYLSNELQAAELSDTTRFDKLTANRYQVRQATYLRAYYLSPGDLIRLERPDRASLRGVARQLGTTKNFAGRRVLFYHLGSRMMQDCELEFLEELAKILTDLQN